MVDVGEEGGDAPLGEREEHVEPAVAVAVDADGVEPAQEVRQGLGLLAARLAAQRRTEEDLESIRAIVRRRRRHFDADIDFHLCVDRAGRNPLPLGLRTTMSAALRDTVLAEGMRHSTADAHQALYEAVEAADPAAGAAAQAILDV